MTPVAPTPRLRWPDVAKGLCITLVVLHHVVGKHLVVVAPPEAEAVALAWSGVSGALRPVRMPLFFVISGFFAARALDRPWRQVVRRVAGPAYLYVVWLLLLGAFFTVERGLVTNRTQDLGELAGDLLWASTTLWFLYALAVYFVVLKLLRRLPTGLLLPATGVLAVGAGLLPIEEANRVSVLVHLVWFAVGARCPAALAALASTARRGQLAIGAALLVTGSAVASLLGVPSPVRVAVLSVVGVPVGVWSVVALCRWAERSRAVDAGVDALGRLGRRTLPVYVLHLPLLALVHQVLTLTARGPEEVTWLVAAVEPLVVTLAVVVASLLVHDLARRVGLGVLFALPDLRPGRTLPLRPRPRVTQAALEARSGRATTTMLDR